MDQFSVLLGISNSLCAVLFVCLSLPLLKGRIRMNRWYGIRFKKAYESEKNWYRLNRYGAERIITWSVPLLVVGVATFFVPLQTQGGPRRALIVALASAPLIVLIPAVESYLYSRTL